MAKRRSRFAFARFGCFGGQARAEKKAEDGYPVKLHIYDLSHGLARQLSATILGKTIEGIWHTGVVVYGREYYFGGGIQKVQPGRTPYGAPVRVMDLGVTYVPPETFKEFLQEIGPRYTPATYNLLTHNCNNFSNEVAQFLAGTSVPSFILELPNEVINSPVGAILLPPMIQGLDTSLRAGAVPQPPQLKMTPSPGAVAAATATRPFANDVEARSTAAGKPEDGKTVGNGDDRNNMVVPPAVQPAPVATTMTRPSTDDVKQGSSASDKPEDGKTAGNGDDNGRTVVPPTVQPGAQPAAGTQVSAAPADVATKAAHQDPMAEAKSRVQEEMKDGKMADHANDNSSVVVPAAVQSVPVDTDTMTRPLTDDVAQGSAAAGKPEDSKTAGNSNDNASAASSVVPPAVQPAAPPATAAQVSTAPAVVARKAVHEFPLWEAKSRVQEETEDGKMADNGNDNCSMVVPPAVHPTTPPAATAEVSVAPAIVARKAAPADPLAEAKSRVQEEIKREFAAIMATGTARAGEAAALAMRSVMERHGVVTQRG